jgi:kynurenine formamidase
MLIDLSVLVTEYAGSEVITNEKIGAFGHLGTHFDVMDKEFPLSFVKRKGIIFNVREIFDRDISISDIDPALIQPDMFVAFYSGFIEKFEYGSKEYFSNHPQLSNELIDQLLDKRISIIGIDFAGVRRGSEHTIKDQYCADQGVFIVENLYNLHTIVETDRYKHCEINTYPIKFAGLTGLPCRVVAEIP